MEKCYSLLHFTIVHCICRDRLCLMPQLIIKLYIESASWTCMLYIEVVHIPNSIGQSYPIGLGLTLTIKKTEYSYCNQCYWKLLFDSDIYRISWNIHNSRILFCFPLTLVKNLRKLTNNKCHACVTQRETHMYLTADSY